MDPNSLIEALRGTMDPNLREAAERQLNEVHIYRTMWLWWWWRRARAPGLALSGAAWSLRLARDPLINLLCFCFSSFLPFCSFLRTESGAALTRLFDSNRRVGGYFCHARPLLSSSFELARRLTSAVRRILNCQDFLWRNPKLLENPRLSWVICEYS